MELLLSDEQKILRDSAARFAERKAGPKAARVQRTTETGYDRAIMGDAAESGWLGILVPESADGLGLGLTELALVLEQAGRGLVTAPILATAVSARTIAEGDSADLRDKLLPDLVGGKSIVLPATGDVTSHTLKAADGKNGGLTLGGQMAAVPNAAGADGFILGLHGPRGDVLVYVPANAQGLKATTRRTVDGGSLTTLALSNAAIPADQIIAGPNRAPALGAAMYESILVGTGAELLGVMGRALDIALDYLKVRKQFDRPIGSFQALQHRAVDEYIEVETTRSLVFEACAAMDAGRGHTAMAHAVKAKASGSALAVCKAAIQLHGAIGFTDEHDIGLYLKRAMALCSAYGNGSFHRARLAQGLVV